MTGTMNAFAMLHADDKFVYLSSNDYQVIAKTPRTDSLVRDMLTAWRASIEIGCSRAEEVPENARELLTFMQERGTDYYEAWNAWGRRVASHTINAPAISSTRFISMGRRMILDSLLSPAMPC